MFRTVPLSIIRLFSLYTRNGICHTGLLTACEQDQEGTYHCWVHSEKLLMMDRGTVRNMQSFIPKINLRNQCF